MSGLITQDTIERVRQTADIVSVINAYTNLTQRGAQYWGCCPFHNEKTPSFYVTPSKGIYNCFGCGKAGDSVRFLMDYEHMDYPAALRYLAQKYHIEVQEEEMSAEEIANRQRRESVMLLWKLMFDPTENGMLNQLLAMFGVARQVWLQDPAWAMTCCILPGVWAGAGMASLIYIAALGSLPPDYYEAAAIDGAGIFARFRHITFPQLMPLMVINFVGAFIAAFQGMGSIFLLTFGGPGDATNVLSLMIWKEAYNNLRFSTATTMAWFLGVALIGFTYLQIRFLRRVEFRSAAAN